MSHCEICNKPCIDGFHTCGNSFCQEASYHRNAARIARSNKRKNFHWAKYEQASQKAQMSK